MPTIAFVAPLLPEMSEVERNAMASCWHGERKAAFEDARRRAGVTRETVWIQPTPMGDVAVVFMEADDVEAAFGVIGASDERFDIWFRDHVRQVHGFSLEDGFHAPELVLDYQANSSHS
jgi:hypothetical protein